MALTRDWNLDTQSSDISAEEIRESGRSFQEGNQSVALTRDRNLDAQSSDISAEEIRESGRTFQSLIVCGKKLLLYASVTSS